MQSSPCSAPEASRFGVSSLNSSPQTWQTEHKRDHRTTNARCVKLTSQPRATHRSGVLLQTRDHGVLRFPLGAETAAIQSEREQIPSAKRSEEGGSGPDQAQRVPHGDGAVAEATGEESKRKGVALDGARARPGEAVETVRGGRGGEEREVRGVGLEVEAEDLDVGGGGEAQVDGAGHGARGEVRRVRRQRRQRRPLRALDARHRRRDRADLGARAIARPGQGRFTEELRGRSRSKRKEKRGGGDAAGEGFGRSGLGRIAADLIGRGFALTAYPAWRAETLDLEAFGRLFFKELFLNVGCEEKLAVVKADD
jgi:hypothetical protein